MPLTVDEYLAERPVDPALIEMHRQRLLAEARAYRSVSYTHLTLPTICSV